MKQHIINIAVFLSILLVAILVRFIGINWDSGYMLHPDERFLVMVGTAMTIPQTFISYLTTATSTMNPENVGYDFFVYGSFPVILNKLLAVWTDNDTYNAFAYLGRAISATADVLTVILVYKIAQLFAWYRGWSKKVPYIAMALYALAVMPIQLSHYFTVDTFLNMFVVAATYFCLRYRFTARWYWLFPAGLCFGLALASKISAVYFAPLLGLFMVLGVVNGKSFRIVHKNKNGGKKPQYAETQEKTNLTIWKSRGKVLRVLGLITIAGLLFTVVAYLAVRLANPYYFEEPVLWSLSLNEQWLASIESLESLNNPDVWFPPAIQWINTTPVWFPLKNMVVLGLGIPFTILVILGMYHAVRQKRRIELIVILLWLAGFFLYQSIQFSKNMRYFITLYPFFALIAGYGWAQLSAKRWWQHGLILLAVIIWPLMFMNVYLQPHTRVAASYWIYENIPDGSYILSEHWDDPLPLMVPTRQGKSFSGEQLEVFGEDTDYKMQTIEEKLSLADYYILSSNRAWGSIQNTPQRYPRMSDFYEDLLAEKKGYEVIYVGTSYPSLEWLGIPLTLPTDWADESFTVYDHPKVIILQNTKQASPEDMY
ncbi:MAG: glycosyltransferase family 39 protein [Patescibacteria group bacterium]